MLIGDLFEHECTNWRRRQTFNTTSDSNHSERAHLSLSPSSFSSSSSSPFRMIKQIFSITLVNLLFILLVASNTGITVAAAAAAAAATTESQQSSSNTVKLVDLSSSSSSSKVVNFAKTQTSSIVGRKSLVVDDGRLPRVANKTTGVERVVVAGFGAAASRNATGRKVQSGARMASLKGKNKQRASANMVVTSTVTVKYGNHSDLMGSSQLVAGVNSSLIDDLAARNRRQLCKFIFMYLLYMYLLITRERSEIRGFIYIR